VEGPLEPAELGPRIGALSEAILPLAARLPVAGLLSLGFRVAPTGRVTAVQLLSDTTRAPAAAETERRRLVATARAEVAAWRFPRLHAFSRVTLPLVFER
jgi:hypothetical protein